MKPCADCDMVKSGKGETREGTVADNVGYVGHFARNRFACH